MVIYLLTKLKQGQIVVISNKKRGKRCTILLSALVMHNYYATILNTYYLLI